jgi:pyrroloquinoline quinone biosynthesis protein E
MTPRPYTLVAELTHRCPLACPYCANPLSLVPGRRELDTATWTRVLREAEEVGVVQVHFTGGEPLVRADLEDLVATARQLGLYSHLVTSGVPLGDARLERLIACGLDAVQLSIQDVDEAAADRIAGAPVARHKRELARRLRALGVPLTLNVVLHRGNIAHVRALIELAEELGVARLELANAQYLGWALANRAALLPSTAAVARARGEALAARRGLRGRMEIAFVLADYHRGRPKPCMDGWGRRFIVVTPEGRVQPCHLAHTIAGLALPSVDDGSVAELWRTSAAFERFRGEDWMPEPCRSCPERSVDFGGCRCQAFALTGDAAATDPACRLAPDHAVVAAACATADEGGAATLRARGRAARSPAG